MNRLSDQSVKSNSMLGSSYKRKESAVDASIKSKTNEKKASKTNNDGFNNTNSLS